VVTYTAFSLGSVGAVALARAARVSELRRLTITSEDEAAAIRAELLDYVQQESPILGGFVNLRSFWKARPTLTPGDHAVVLAPLLAQRILLVEGHTDAVGLVVAKLMERIFLPLPDKVSLSPRDWHRLVNGDATSWTIIAEQIDMSQTWNSNTNTGSGQLFSSQSGGHSSSEVSKNRAYQDRLSPDEFGQVAAALRSDTSRVDDPEARALLLALADDCDTAAATPDPDGSATQRILQTATSYATLTSGALEATSKVLAAFKHLM